MQSVDGKLMNKFANGNNHLLSATDFNNGTNYGRVISLLVLLLRFFKKKFLDNVGELLRKMLADFGMCIFRRHHTCHSHHLKQHCAKPVVDILLGLLGKGDFFGGIINQRTELVLVVLTQVHPKNIVNLSADNTRSIFEDMRKSGVLTVKVGDKMLCTLGQV